MRILRLTFQLSQTYGANTLIYRLRALPFAKKLITDRAYEYKEIKDIFSILVGILRFFKVVGGKFGYFALFVLFPAMKIPGDSAQNFRHILLLGTLAGMFFNTYMFEPDKEKFYAIVLMRMNAREYIRVHFLWFVGKALFVSLPAIILFGRHVGLPLWECILFPIMIAAVKPMGAYYFVKRFEVRGKLTVEMRGYQAFIMMGIALTVMYVPLFLKRALPAISFPITLAVVILLGIPAMIYLWNTRIYQSLYLKMLNLNTVVFNVMEKSSKTQRDAYASGMDASGGVISNKSGYEYFSEIFVKRHKKILGKSAMMTSTAAIIATIAITVGILFSGELKESINRMMLNMFPYFVFIMYMTNSASKITQAMFINCDHSMLTYRFYREKETILRLFRLRLAMIIKINLIPGTIIGLALPYALFISGKTDNPLNYLLMFLAMIATVILFSVHHLAIYYIFQPYNISMKSKSSTYSIINVVTYFACYAFIRIRVPTTIFSIILILFTVVYVTVVLYMVNRFAPTRFKLKN